MGDKKKAGGVMARRKGEIQLQQELETQEEWEEMLSKEGLCVIDVYQEWAGPCAGMLGTFKRIKNELGDPLLKFLTAKADMIDALEKYRRKCEPCFLFFAGGVLVAVIRGANAPLILRTITEQLAQEHKVLDGQSERKEIIDPVIAMQEEKEKNGQEDEAETKDEDARRMKFQGEIIDFGDVLTPRQSEAVKEVSVVIIKPDAVQAGKSDDIIQEMTDRGIEILRQEERQLTEEEARDLYQHLQDEPIFEDLVKFMSSSPCRVLAITKGKTGENVIKEFRDLIGPTTVEEAKEQAPESLRAKYGSDNFMNAVHGSDSADTAARELAFFFPDFAAPPVEGRAPLQRTLALIRPDAYSANKEEILAKIRESGFKVAMSKVVQLDREQAEEFYSEHRGQDYFEELTTRMSSGPLLALGLAREDAIQGWRQILGPKELDDAKEQAPDSLRAQFAVENVPINQLHGSDSEETAKKELQYFFPVEQTVAAIKPDAISTKDEIVSKIHDAGFRIAARKETVLSREMAEEFYADQKDKDYYNDLVEHMISGPTMFMVLSREGAVDGWRSMIGPTDPTQARDADPDALRALFGKDVKQNAVHGSSTVEHANQSIMKIFGELQFNPDGTVKEEGEEDNETLLDVPGLAVHKVLSINPDDLEDAIAEQQQISYELAPGFGQEEQETEPAEQREGDIEVDSVYEEDFEEDDMTEMRQSEGKEQGEARTGSPAQQAEPEKPKQEEVQQEQPAEEEKKEEQTPDQPVTQAQEPEQKEEPKEQEQEPSQPEPETKPEPESKPEPETKPEEQKPAEEQGPAQQEEGGEPAQQATGGEETKPEEQAEQKEEQKPEVAQEEAKPDEAPTEQKQEEQKVEEGKPEEQKQEEKKEEQAAEGETKPDAEQSPAGS